MIGMPTNSFAARMVSLCAGAFLLAGAGCGLIHKDVPVSQTIQVGGLPTSLSSFGSSDFTAPLSAGAGDVSSLSSVNLTFATLAEQDTGEDLSFVTGGTITVSANGLDTVQLATLSPPGAVGTTNYTIINQPDLRPYLESSTGAIAVSVTYSSPPVPARSLKLTLNFHATL